MKKILVQAIKFIGISGLGWLLDCITYSCLLCFSSDAALDNYISSWVGVTFVYIFSTRRIFENNGKIPLKWKYVIYLLYQIILILLISKLLGCINEYIVREISNGVIVRYSAIVSKILVTPITMVLNFFVMKKLIEKL